MIESVPERVGGCTPSMDGAYSQYKFHKTEYTKRVHGTNFKESTRGKRIILSVRNVHRACQGNLSPYILRLFVWAVILEGILPQCFSFCTHSTSLYRCSDGLCFHDCTRDSGRRWSRRLRPMSQYRLYMK